MKNLICLIIVLSASAAVMAENIDPDNSNNQYAYGENVGWVNFEGAYGGATVSKTKLSGYVWGENIGWINLSPASYGGIANDGFGNLSGYAWGENVGWINFNPQYGGTSYAVKIDSNGYFSGYAWGENIGWINFNNASLSSQGVKVCIVNYVDLKTMANQWCNTTSGNSADLNTDDKVNFKDFNILASYWFDYCPDNWPL